MLPLMIAATPSLGPHFHLCSSPIPPPPSSQWDSPNTQEDQTPLTSTLKLSVAKSSWGQKLESMTS